MKIEHLSTSIHRVKMFNNVFWPENMLEQCFINAATAIQLYFINHEKSLVIF